jgi:LysR family hydrogen peroxide-inducible transcriptional activator
LTGELKGELKIGIIPTVAPYLLPGFLNKFLKNYPLINVKITELTTELIVDKLKAGILDVGIIATPLNDSSIIEHILFKEEFFVYAAKGESILNKKYILAGDIDVNRLLLLEEGHCLRSQIVSLCELKKNEAININLQYEAGSLESLIKMVDQNNGITILPELAVLGLNKKQKSNIREFRAPVPVREISIVTYKHFYKTGILNALKEAIIAITSGNLISKEKQVVIPI